MAFQFDFESAVIEPIGKKVPVTPDIPTTPRQGGRFDFESAVIKPTASPSDISRDFEPETTELEPPAETGMDERALSRNLERQGVPQKTEGRFSAAALAIPRAIKEGVVGFGEGVIEGGEQIEGIIESDQSGFSKTLQVLGAGLTPTKNLFRDSFGSLLGSANDALFKGEADEVVAEKLSNFLETDVGKEYGKMFDEVSGSYNDLEEFVKEEHPELAGNVGAIASILEVATELTGAGAGKRGLKKTAELSGEVLETTAQRVKDIELPKFRTKKDAESFVKNIPKAQEITMADKLSNSLNKIDPVAGQQKFQKMTGQSAGEWLNDRGFTGNREENVKKLVTYWKNSKAKVDKALRIPKEKFKSTEYGEAIDILEKELGKRSNDRPKFEKLMNSFDEGGLTLSQENELKRIYERNVALSYKKDITKSSKAKRDATDLDDALREGLIGRAENLGIKDIKGLNRETQAARHLADQISGKALKQASNNTMSLTDNILFSGAGIAGAVNPSFLAGYGALKLAKSELMHSTAIRLLNKRALKVMPEPDFKKIEASAKRRQEKLSQLQAETTAQTPDIPEIEGGKSTPRQTGQELPEVEGGLLNGSSPENLAEKAKKVNLENKVELLKSGRNIYKESAKKWRDNFGKPFPITEEAFLKQFSKGADIADVKGFVKGREKAFAENLDKKMEAEIDRLLGRELVDIDVNEEIKALATKAGILKMARGAGFKGKGSREAFEFIEKNDAAKFATQLDDVAKQMEVSHDEVFEQIKEIWNKANK